MELKDLKAKYFVPEMSGEQIMALRTVMEKAKEENRRQDQKRRFRTCMGAVAAAAVLFVLLPNTSASMCYAMSHIPVIGALVELVTFREYYFTNELVSAEVQVAGLPEDMEGLEEAASGINEEIRQIADRQIAEFEEFARQELGYKELLIQSEIIASTERYLTLRLNCYEGSASGYEWNYYFTVDLKTQERLELQDLFPEGTDYLGKISDHIKSQMRSQMKEDENCIYWLDSEMAEMDFQEITNETGFYLNAEEKLVIAFPEGEVAPSYMGTVEFEIPWEVVE